jgi:hypothetical protein
VLALDEHRGGETLADAAQGYERGAPDVIEDRRHAMAPSRHSIDTRGMRRFATLLTFLLLAGSARADMLPDPNSVDAHCTLAEQCPDGVECPSGIRQDASAVQACDDAQDAKGLKHRCQRGGNYFGTAVYCRPDAHGSWSPPPGAAGGSPNSTEPASSPSRGGCGRCAISAQHGSTGLAALAGGAVALILLGRRRARRTDNT